MQVDNPKQGKRYMAKTAAYWLCGLHFRRSLAGITTGLTGPLKPVQSCRLWFLRLNAKHMSERELTEPGTILKTTISHVFILPAIRLTELQSQKWKSYCFGQSLNAPPLFKAGTRYVLCFKEKGKPKLNLRFYKRHKTWEYNYFLKYIMYLCAKLLGPKPAFFTLWLWILIDVTLEFHTILN